MSIETIRAAVTTLLRQVSGVAVVNESQPFGDAPDFFEGHYIDPTTKKVNGWTVSVVDENPAQRIGTIEHAYTVTVRGLVGIDLNDEGTRNAATVETLTGALVAKFGQSIANRRLSSTVHYTDPPRITVAIVKARMASGLKDCHLVTMTFRAYFEEALVA